MYSCESSLENMQTGFHRNKKNNLALKKKKIQTMVLILQPSLKSSLDGLKCKDVLILN